MTSNEPDVEQVAAALQLSIRLLRRQLRQSQVDSADDLTVPETSALAVLDRGGPTTPGALAKVEQISPQSMGATLGALEARGFVERQADPADGRRVLMSITDAGMAALRVRRTARTEQLAQALSAGFTNVELRQLMTAAPLIERLAHNL
ncbi:MAG TPA: MarR family transcriptional regulator [Acidothermaceae bacterium]|nr:MarR family transcriptional regulator [Acidothermaceae bacterium]